MSLAAPEWLKPYLIDKGLAPTSLPSSLQLLTFTKRTLPLERVYTCWIHALTF